MERACNYTHDTVCADCPENMYMPVNATLCVPCSPCDGGMEPVIACTPTTDRVCDYCQEGFFSPEGNHTHNGTHCEKCTDCVPGQYVTPGAENQCTPFHDRKCTW